MSPLQRDVQNLRDAIDAFWRAVAQSPVGEVLLKTLSP